MPKLPTRTDVDNYHMSTCVHRQMLFWQSEIVTTVAQPIGNVVVAATITVVGVVANTLNCI